MRLLSSSLVLLFVLAACGPKINPAMQSATDELLSSYRTSATVPAPRTYQPMSWAKGQWAAYKVTEGDKPPAVTLIKVVDQNKDGFWLETEHQDYYGHSVTRMLYSKQPGNAQEAVDALQKVVMRQDGEEVQEIDFATHPMGAMMKRSMTSATSNVTAPEVSEETREDVTVPAGTFQGAAKFRTVLQFGPYKRTFVGWFHPTVPLNGGVRSESEDGKVVSELVGFGTTGAKSAF